MKYSQYLRFLLLLTIVNNLTGCIGSWQGESVDLAMLLPNPKKLPPGTHLVEVSEGEKLPFGMEENPTVSEDRAFIAAFSRGLFGDAVEPENISRKTRKLGKLGKATYFSTLKIPIPINIRSSNDNPPFTHTLIY